MGRPPSNGGPVFRFNPTEVAEMETILQEHNTQMPTREVLVALAEKFSASVERSGKIVVQMRQVWNWFQNRRHALRSKAKLPRMLSMSPISWDDSTAVRNIPQAPQYVTAPVNPTICASPMPWDDSTAVRNVPQTPLSVTAPVNPTICASPMPWDDSTAVRNVPQTPQSVTTPVSFSVVRSAGRTVSDKYHMEFEAKSARDGAWYDVAMFLSHRALQTGDADVLVRFAGLGPEADEWVNIRRHVRPRSLPCESSECAAVLPGDLILCYQEGNEQALYFDAHVRHKRRRRHDLRGCRCRFRVQYDHDQSEEVVPLRKICRRPETDYRLRKLRTVNKSGSVNRQKIGAADAQTGNTLTMCSSTEPMQEQQKVEECADAAAMVPPPPGIIVPVTMKPKVLQPKIIEISTCGNVETSRVLPANVAVTSGDAANTITSGSGQVGTSMVPPANVAVTSGDAANTITGGSAQNMSHG